MSPASQKIPIHPALQPYVVEISVLHAAKSGELAVAAPYKVLPQPYAVMGFQFRGRLEVWRDNQPALLSRSGLTALQTASRLFQPQLDTGTILVVFRPYGIFPLLGYAMHELSDLHPGLDSFLPPTALRELEERLAETDASVELGEIVQTFLLSLIERARWLPPSSVIAAANSIIQAPGQVRVETLANDLGFSKRQLERLFQQYIGLPPKSFASLARFDWAARKAPEQLPLIELAAQAGYTDQAHLTRHFLRYSGNPPGQYRRQFLAQP